VKPVRRSPRPGLLSGRLGPLVERDFRLLFVATSITTVGDRLATIALAFAVLDLGSVTDLGLVLAARQIVEALVLVAGGVLSDRLPRQLVLTGASLVQGVAQALTATLLLSGAASVSSLIVLQALYGIGAGLIVPAEVGLVPQTVTAERLQQANALQGLSRNMVGVLGPAVGGAIVVAANPGVALAADAASFFICAALLARIRVPPPAREQSSFLAELREGWNELTAQTWIWSTIGIFGFSNMFYAGSWAVLGPAIAESELGGAAAWATILAAGGVGSVAGALLVLRYSPRRPLVACVLAPVPMVLPLVGLALSWPTSLIAGASFLASIGLAVHLALWFTVFQRHVPEHAQSRVSSYDALGSFVLIPVGMALVGPIAGLIGTTTTLLLTVGVFLTAAAVIVSIPSVRAIRAPEAAAIAVS
jgi:Major Facilitator Superfamily